MECLWHSHPLSSQLPRPVSILLHTTRPTVRRGLLRREPACEHRSFCLQSVGDASFSGHSPRPQFGLNVGGLTMCHQNFKPSDFQKVCRSHITRVISLAEHCLQTFNQPENVPVNSIQLMVDVSDTAQMMGESISTSLCRQVLREHTNLMLKQKTRTELRYTAMTENKSQTHTFEVGQR